ncbi:unnamed protein product [Rotaria sp. Silwood2]|nr:unnamed protein product [Rotaria sp. Silwood2]CAF3083257.1 unnamed protein product [Rotaria sp. Silwood2]CAF4236668.1 unnamed protein product [Rotaria sp. Silwood2]CAF4367460.1 unnamed protein product [Rotaria sp. Silwood2]
MSHHLPYHLKRLQDDVSRNLHLSTYNHHSQHSTISHTNSFDYRSQFPNEEIIRESIQHFTISANHDTKLFRPFKPHPQQARRGGGRSRGYRGNSSLSLPKRMINYDLAESFMDHSTNPLSSDLYKLKFKNSNKTWSNGRFINYKEKLDKLDGNIIEITCTRTFPIVYKRKKIEEIKQNEQNNQQHVTGTTSTTSLLALFDPIVQQEKKKQINQQTNFYANLFGGRRIPRLSSITQIKKTNSTFNSTSSSSSLSSSTSISLLNENSKDH